MRRTFLNIALAAAMIFGAANVNAQQANQNNGCGGNGYCKELKLSDDQAKKIKEIRDNASAKTLKLDLQIKEKKAHLDILRVADKVDMVAINYTVDEIAKLKTERAKIREASIQEIRKNLTPEQRLAMDRRGYNHFGKQGKSGGCHGNQHMNHHQQGNHQHGAQHKDGQHKGGQQKNGEHKDGLGQHNQHQR